MKLTQLISTIVPKKIKNPEQLKQVLGGTHSSPKFLGIHFSPKFKLTQDVFEEAKPWEFTLPKNLFLKFVGEGNPKISLVLKEGAVLKGKKATFGTTSTSGRNLVLDTVNGSLYSYKTGKSKVKLVTGEAHSFDTTVQKNATVNGRALAYSTSEQTNGEVFQDAISLSKARQFNRKVKGNALSESRSYQNNGTVEGHATSRDASNQSNNNVLGNATSYNFSNQTNQKVLKNAISNDNSIQVNWEVQGKHQRFGCSEQRINKPKH